MDRKLVISGSLLSLNEYVNRCRTNRFAGGKAKKEMDEYVSWFIRSQLKGVSFSNEVEIDFLWVLKDRRQDPDNVCFAKKFILDALVKCGTIPNDSLKYVRAFSDNFSVDKENPRIEVLIRETAIEV